MCEKNKVWYLLFIVWWTRTMLIIAKIIGTVDDHDINFQTCFTRSYLFVFFRIELEFHKYIF